MSQHGCMVADWKQTWVQEMSSQQCLAYNPKLHLMHPVAAHAPCCPCTLLQVINETLPALHALKAQGLVRFVGITGLPLNMFKYVLDRAPPGEWL